MSGMPHPSGMPLKRNKDVVRETTYKVVAPKGSTTSPGAPGNQHHDERYVRHAPRRTAAPKGQEHARQHHEREGTTNERSSPTGHQADLNETWMSRDAFIRQADDEAPRPYMRFVNPYGTIYLHPRTEDFPTLWAQYLNMTMERRDAAYGHPTRALPHEAQPDVPDQHQHELPVQQDGMDQRAAARDTDATILYEPTQAPAGEGLRTPSSKDEQAPTHGATPLKNLTPIQVSESQCMAQRVPIPSTPASNPHEGAKNDEVVATTVNRDEARRCQRATQLHGSASPPPEQRDENSPPEVQDQHETPLTGQTPPAQHTRDKKTEGARG